MTEPTRVVNVRFEEHDVSIMRPTKWGNPFVVGKHGSREQVIRMYETHVRNSPKLMEALSELRGKRLGCCCRPKPCHGDVLLKLISELEKEER
jgi:Schitoviridae RNA polymerase